MIGKFLSKALLTVVMDKSARQKLEQRRRAAPTTAPKVQDASPSSGAPALADDLASTIEAALADARSEAAGDEQPRAPVPSVPSAGTRGDARPMTPEREALIRNAMAIQREKTQVLDDLDQAAREKLQVMAMMALDPGSLPPDARRVTKTPKAGPTKPAITKKPVK